MTLRSHQVPLLTRTDQTEDNDPAESWIQTHRKVTTHTRIFYGSDTIRMSEPQGVVEQKTTDVKSQEETNKKKT